MSMMQIGDHVFRMINMSSNLVQTFNVT